MPPKKKTGKKKKSLAAIKALEAERQAAEDRARREREQQAAADEAREAERQRLLEEEARRRREEESARLEAEEALMDAFTARRARALDAEAGAAREASSWARYLACSPLPDPAVEHELTAWISLWTDKREWELGECMGMAEATAATADDLLRVLALRESSHDRARCESLKAYRAELRAVTTSKIDEVTANVLQHADEYATAKNEVQLRHSTRHFKYGLWVNLARNPRVKQVDFAELGLTCQVTKSLAIANIAIRLMHVRFDWRTEGGDSKHVPLGGVFSYELLALPPAPKRVKQWTLRQVTELAESVSVLDYPLQASDPTGAAATVTPVTASFTLPEDCLLKEDIPTIGWWDPARSAWRTEGISESSYSESTRVVSFLTTHLGPLAVLQNRYPDLRFERWELQPTGVDRAVFTLHITGRDVAIELSPGGARLLTPKDKELSALQTETLPVRLLLHRLAESGIYILPSEADIRKLNGANVKDVNMLYKMHADMAAFGASHAFAWSRWNREGGVGARAAVFRVKEYLKWDAPLRLDEDEQWSTVLYRDNNDVLLISATESADAFDDVILEGEKYHLSLYNTLTSAGVSEEAEHRMNDSSARFTESIRLLLDSLRIMDFC
jgi:cancer susceptibility candidate protein 1